MMKLLSRMMGLAVPSHQVSVEKIPDFGEVGDETCQLVSHPRQIADILQDLVHAHARVFLGTRSPARLLSTQMIHADPEGDYLLVRNAGDAEDMAAVLASGQLNLIAAHKEDRVIFTLNVMGRTEHEGVNCLRLSFPVFGFCVQLRRSLRVALPSQLHAKLLFSPDGKAQIDAHLFDLSEGGIGFMVNPATAAQLVPGERMTGVSLQVRDLRIDGLNLLIRYVKKPVHDKVLVGTELQGATETELQKIRRLILLYQISSRTRD